MAKVIHCKTCLKVISEIDEPLFDGEEIVTDENGCIGFCKDYDPDDMPILKVSVDNKPLPKAYIKMIRNINRLPVKSVKAERLPPRLKF